MAKTRILVVEDDNIVAMDLQHMLVDLGYSVVAVAKSGEDAVEREAELNPDLVLMDIKLDGSMDGIEAAGHIRDRAAIPVIYLTAYSDEAMLRRATVSEPAGYVLKPISEGALHAAIETAVYKHGMEMTRLAERKALEDQLLQAQKMEAVGQLTGGLAHDFNNSLSVISGFCELGLEDASPEDPMSDYLREIQKAGEQASDLTRQLLTFSRRQIIEPRVLDLKETIMDVDKMLRQLVREDIKLVTVLQSQGLVKVDPGHIQQVLMNLIVNARDASPNGGKVIIETADVSLDDKNAGRASESATEGHVMLAVSDTGIGMTEEVMAHIFEPFFTTKEAGRGTGLGLSTCHRIVSQNGGYISVESEPGKGTRFKIYFPRVDELSERCLNPLNGKRYLNQEIESQGVA